MIFGGIAVRALKEIDQAAGRKSEGSVIVDSLGTLVLIFLGFFIYLAAIYGWLGTFLNDSREGYGVLKIIGLETLLVPIGTIVFLALNAFI